MNAKLLIDAALGGDEKPEIDSDDLLGNWVDNLGGVYESNRVLYELITAIGYDGIDDFLRDNEGACDKLIEFISEYLPHTISHGEDGWFAKLKAIVSEQTDKELRDYTSLG